MKKILLIPLICLACNKNKTENPQPQKNHNVQVMGQSRFHSAVYIDGALQSSNTQVFTIKTGQKFRFTDTGEDTFNPTTLITNEMYINVKVLVDGAEYEKYQGYQNVDITYIAD